MKNENTLNSIELLKSEIGKYPLLGEDETRRLVALAQAGDIDAMHTIINANLKLVMKITKEYVGRGVDVMDLFQEGATGVQHAIKKFDLSGKSKFSVYAATWIRERMGAYILENGRTIRLPNNVLKTFFKINKAQKLFAQENGYDGDIEEISEYMGGIYSPKQITEILMQTRYVVSYDVPVKDYEGNCTTLLYFIGDSIEEEEYMEYSDNERRLATLMACLSNKEKEVLIRANGLFSHDQETLDEISNSLHVSKERVRQIKAEAVAKMKKYNEQISL